MINSEKCLKLLSKIKLISADTPINEIVDHIHKDNLYHWEFNRWGFYAPLKRCTFEIYLDHQRRDDWDDIVIIDQDSFDGIKISEKIEILRWLLVLHIQGRLSIGRVSELVGVGIHTLQEVARSEKFQRYLTLEEKNNLY